MTEPESPAFEVEAASAGLIKVAGLEAVGPVTFVIFGGEVARTGAGDKRFPDGSGVALVARTPGSGRDVHNVAPALLVLDRRDAVDHVTVPPSRVPGADVGDTGERLQDQRVPGVTDGEHLVRGHAAHVIVGDVGEKRPQHEVAHGLGDRYGVEHTLVVGHIG
jgi:hypothetical protein